MKTKIKPEITISIFGDYCCHDLRACIYNSMSIGDDFCTLFQAKLKKKHADDQWKFLRCKKCMNATQEHK